MINSKTKKDGAFYVWFHHCALDHDDREYIYEVIEHHDYEEFMRIRRELQKYEDEETVFLPKLAFVCDDEGEIIEEIDITKKRNFFRIAHNEYECG